MDAVTVVSSTITELQDDAYHEQKNEEKNILLPKARLSIEDIIENLCASLDCKQLKFQIEKVNTAREQLVKAQNRRIFKRLMGSVVSTMCNCDLILGPYTEEEEEATAEIHTATGLSDNLVDNLYELSCEEEAGICICPSKHGEAVELPPEDCWHGYFKGYHIMTEHDEFSMKENLKCIQVTYQTPRFAIENYLRCGVRCLLIDLFIASLEENQALIVRIRECELTVSDQIGFPVCCTICAMLSPRFQYTGYFDKCNPNFQLDRDDMVTLTTNRHWANRGTKERIYVNARYLLIDTEPCDILLLGSQIQLQVTEVLEDCIKCKVIEGGRLQPRMPVLFNRRCFRFRMSMEELEDLTFAKEVGVNILISYMPGSLQYFVNLRECMRLLNCENLRLFARIVLNDEECGCKKDYVWAAEHYDGFVFDLTLTDDRPYEQDLLCIGSEMTKFIERAHELMKPIILDPILLIEKHFIVHPSHELHIFHYPDKYLFKYDRKENSHFFHMLAEAISKPMTLDLIREQIPYCDHSKTGSNSLAMATVRASVDMHASCIFVLGHTGRMVIKISHFRPQVPIYFITSMKSAEKFISAYNRVNMLYYHSDECGEMYEFLVLKQFLFGMVCAMSNKVLKDKDYMILVYSSKDGQLFPDKYLILQFQQETFIEDLRNCLF